MLKLTLMLQMYAVTPLNIGVSSLPIHEDRKTPNENVHAVKVAND